ncbi:hypothetical protein BASA62_003813 [Batrachochytrium salamandrivorans]|nr:hypothetical protein BASA62_003813 [Batrachochytrium salamandrivorans]
MTTALPREIIKWIQGHDLSYTVKNHKRDFANGFLIAEILSKLYPADVQMHAFDTGSGAGAKKNNWGILERVFIRNSIPISKEICSNVAACDSKSVNMMLSVIYWHSSNKTLPPEECPATSIAQELQLDKNVVVGGRNDAENGSLSREHLHVETHGNGKAIRLSGDIHAEKNSNATSDRILYSTRQQNQLNEGVTKHASRLNAYSSLSGSGGYASMRQLNTLASSTAGSKIDATFEEVAMGRVPLMWIIFQIFNVSDSQVNFHRNTFPTNTARDIITANISTGHQFDIHSLPIILSNRKLEIVSVVRQSPPVDFQLTFDTLLPCMISYGSSTKVFRGKDFSLTKYACTYSHLQFHANIMVYHIFSLCIPVISLAVSIIIQYIGEVCQNMLEAGEGYRRLSAARDFIQLIHQIRFPNIDKIPFIASIIHAYLGPAFPESDRVRVLLDLKALVNKDRAPYPVVQSSSSSGNEFIFFLASFNAERCHNIHSVSYQSTVLHLSECLMIINAFKGSGKEDALLCFSINAPSLSLGMPANTEIANLSTADLPALEVSAALHVVAAIVRAGISLEHRIMANVVNSALRTFLKIILCPQCSSAMQKAYIHVVVALLETLPLDSPADSPQCALLMELLDIIDNILKWYQGQSLRAALILTAGVLHRHPRLCTSYVRGLVSLGDTIRTELLKPTTGENSGSILSWDLPFLLDYCRPQISDIWHEFGISMGVCKATEHSQNPLEFSYLQIICAAVHSFQLPPKSSSEDSSVLIVPQNAWNHIFLNLSDQIISSLAVNENLDLAWDVFSGFMNICSKDVIIQKFPALLGVLVYIHSADIACSRRRILGWLKKWAGMDLLKSSSQPATLASHMDEGSVISKQSPHKFADMKEDLSGINRQPSEAYTIHLEAKRVLQIFMTEFPTLSGSEHRTCETYP